LVTPSRTLIAVRHTSRLFAKSPGQDLAATDESGVELGRVANARLLNRIDHRGNGFREISWIRWFGALDE
jgi:hypothetical protein